MKKADLPYPFFYFEWLLDHVCDQAHSREQFRSLLENLFRREYYAIIFKDRNRVSDGLTLRHVYNSSPKITGKKKLSPEEMALPCSILEALIALAIHMERDILMDDDKGDRTSLWFWLMMENMDLNVMDERRYDPYYVDQVLNKFLNRTYGPDGKGGPFYIPYSVKDLREVELWYQAMWFITAYIT